MTAEDYNAWRDHMNYSKRKAGIVLGVSETTALKYAREGAPDYIGYACSAVAFGLPSGLSNGLTKPRKHNLNKGTLKRTCALCHVKLSCSWKSLL